MFSIVYYLLFGIILHNARMYTFGAIVVVDRNIAAKIIPQNKKNRFLNLSAKKPNSG